MSDRKRISHWDERYANTGYLFGTTPNDFLKSVADRLPPNSKVLCLADGEGRNSVYLAALGHKVTAVDQSRVGLEKAKKLAEEKQVSIETVNADLAEYNLGVESWDCMCLFSSISPEQFELVFIHESSPH